MVKQVVIQLQDFNKNISDVPLPCSPEDDFSASSVEQTAFKVENNLNLNDYRLTNELARQTLIGHVSKSSCCFLGRSYSKKIRILNIDYSFVHCYSLETFSEKRQVCFDFTPCQDHIIIENSEEIPPIWEIESNHNPTPFVNYSETVVIPNSEMIKFCNRCNGNEKRTCPFCLALKKNCSHCNDTHFIKCDVCTNGKLKWHQSLKITWTNHISQYFSRSVIPDEKLKLVEGIVLYEENAVKVNPIEYLEDKNLSEYREKFISTHRDTFLKKEKLLQQRQKVKLIVLANVHYEYGKKIGKFWIYYDRIEDPMDLRVHCPKYSRNCCIGCLVN